MIKKMLMITFKTLRGILLLIFVLFLLLVGGATYLFLNPEILLKESSIQYALEKTQVLNSWSWKKFQVNHELIAWNDRKFSADIDTFCFRYNQIDLDVDSCLNLKFEIEAKWTFSYGLEIKALGPILLVAPKIHLTLSDQEKEDSAPVDYLAYWNIFWGAMIPDFEVKVQELKISKEKPLITLSLDAIKTPRQFKLTTMGYHLVATKDNIVVTAPQKIEIPFDLYTKNPLYFDRLKVEAKILKTEIPVTASAKIDTAELNIYTKIHKKWLKQDLGSPNFIKDVLVKSSASLKILKVKETVNRLMKTPFNQLPAPLNEMEGDLELRLKTEDIIGTNSLNVFVDSELNFQSVNQNLHFIVKSSVPVNIIDYSFGLINLDLDFKKIKLILPRLSKTSLPPQLVPDSRFKNSKDIIRENRNETKKNLKNKDNSKNEIELDMNIRAVGKNFIQLNSNLLDEPVKINLDLEVAKNEIKKGFVKIQPLKTVVFKREIYLANLQIDFLSKIEPRLSSVIEFHLPEYKIFLDLEGPMSSPRHVFRSQPPLPQDDILGVLLFGRPLSSLDNDDKGVARQTEKILQEGILNLAVLYYFAGTPIESIGYDAENNQVSAQLGLGSKSSLRIGGGAQGLSSAGVRRSLGKGWYLDSSVQKTVNDNGTSSGNYGVLLERIIAY